MKNYSRKDDELWKNFLEVVKNSISSLSYETWFRDTKLVTIRNNSAVIIVPMPVHKKHLMENDAFLISNNELTKIKVVY